VRQPFSRFISAIPFSRSGAQRSFDFAQDDLTFGRTVDSLLGRKFRNPL
jgi:hypothetical protein